MMLADGWWSIPHPRPRARARLFCLPYAGAGASLFYRWPSFLPDEVEVAAAQLPGREQRLQEAAIPSFAELLNQISRSAEPLLDRPAILFGHSMGGLLAYEWAHRLADRDGVPAHLILSGIAPPSSFPRGRMSGDDHFVVNRLRALGGTPEGVLDNPELLSLLLPILKADFAVVDSYRHEPGRLLRCPVTVFGGESDISPSPAQLQGWGDHAGADFKVRTFSGGHFFIQPTAPTFQCAMTSIARAVIEGGRT